MRERDAEGDLRVIVLPVTHSRPADPASAVEIPAATKRRLGLDEDQSWIVVTECNVFSWPGPDLRFAPGRGPESVAYGLLPAKLFEIVHERFVALHEERRRGLWGGERRLSALGKCKVGSRRRQLLMNDRNMAGMSALQPIIVLTSMELEFDSYVRCVLGAIRYSAKFAKSVGSLISILRSDPDPR